MFPPILIIGESGSGKSSSIRKLPTSSTAILNIEKKPLPFKNADSFTYHKLINTVPEFEASFAQAVKNPEINIIVLESFHKYLEKLMDFSKTLHKGYDIYNFYNERVGKFLDAIKDNSTTKQIIAFAMPERVEFIQPNGAITTSRRAFVHGKQWEGKIEKEFTVVLFTQVNQPDKSKPADYSFITNNDGTHSAKSPPEMFNGLFIPNDLETVSKASLSYYNLAFPIHIGPPPSSNTLSQTIPDVNVVNINKQSLLNPSLITK